jgi:hypothetical protein
MSAEAETPAEGSGVIARRLRYLSFDSSHFLGHNCNFLH